MKALLYPVWFIFAAVFSYLGYKHWQFSETPLRPFFHRDIDEAEDPPGIIPKEDELARDVVRDLNNYIEKMNDISMRRNRAAALGYFIAAAICVASILIIYTG
jgi:hypothetical protein